MNDPKRLLIIGWDGATWDYIDPLLEAGRLPHLAKLLRGGARATLRSTKPPYTNVAWPSMVTGRSPRQLGIYDGVRLAENSYRRVPVNGRSFRGVRLWEWLNQNGRSAAVLNVPMTYPAQQLDGYMVTGFDSPQAAPDVAYPPNLLSEWSAAQQPYPFLADEIRLMDSQNPHQPRGSLDDFTQQWVALTRAQGQQAAWLWQQQPTDCLFIVFSATDSINHRTNSLPRIERVYQAADDALGQLLAMTDEETLVALVSDHGSTPATHYFSLVRLMADQGWLAYKPQVAAPFWQRAGGERLASMVSSLPEAAQRLISRPFLWVNGRLQAHFDNIDWPNSKLFALSSLGPLYINVRGRYPQGAVDPQAYQSFREEVREHLLSLQDENGRSLIAHVWRKEELYGNDAPSHAPDLLFEPADWRIHPISGFPSDPFLRPIPADKPYGTHTPDGIFALRGPNVRQGLVAETADIIDLFPTLLAAWGLPIPASCEGTVQQVLFNTARPVEMVAAPESGQKGKTAVSDDDAELLDRLKSLGYLDS